MHLVFVKCIDSYLAVPQTTEATPAGVRQISDVYHIFAYVRPVISV